MAGGWNVTGKCSGGFVFRKRQIKTKERRQKSSISLWGAVGEL